jgi:DNA-directed RNA polymerase subunit H (RpoH/RPB5)
MSNSMSNSIRNEQLYERVLHPDLVSEYLREGIGDVVKGAASKAWDATGGAAGRAINNHIIQPVKQKAGEIAKGAANVALTAGAMYVGAKQGEQKAKDEKAQQASEFSAAAEITDSVIGLDKQKYAQLAKIYTEDPELVKNHRDEGEIISQVNTALQRFKPGE